MLQIVEVRRGVPPAEAAEAGAGRRPEGVRGAGGAVLRGRRGRGGLLHDAGAPVARVAGTGEHSGPEVRYREREGAQLAGGAADHPQVHLQRHHHADLPDPRGLHAGAAAEYLGARYPGQATAR